MLGARGSGELPFGLGGQSLARPARRPRRERMDWAGAHRKVLGHDL
jgi:hypothetical protein